MKNVKPPPPPHNFRANRAKSALTALFLLLALASVPLMRGHANLPNNNPDPEQPVNGGNNNQQEAPSYYVSLGSMPSNWLPVADTTFNLSATTDASYDNGKIVFSLSDVTEYEGWHMNDPLRNSTRGGKPHKGKNIRFAPADQQDSLNGKLEWEVDQEEGVAIAKWRKRPIPSPPPFSVPVKLECWDYAAYGVIQAKLQQRELRLRYYTQTSSGSHTIPFDKYPLFGGNKIADAWEQNNGAMYGYPDTSQDCDSGGEKIDPNTQNAVKHGQNNGDGFSVHEEYRGFSIQGSHTRLDPTTKDLFIYSSILPNFRGVTYDYVDQYDLGGTHSLSPEINVRQVWNGEADGQVMNFSRAGVNSKGNQYRIWVTLARNEDINAYGSIPSWAGLHLGTSVQCNIYIEDIDEDFEIDAKARIVVDTTIAHEVGHSVGLADHHAYEGLPDAPPSREACVMISGGFNRAMLLAWQGSGFADFHDDTVHPDHGSWEDHWGMYKLHNNPGGHCSYSKGSSWWQNL